MRFLSVAAALFITVFVASLAERKPAADERVLESGDVLQWRKGNLHTHSHWSDGDAYLESIALWYREQDYDFLCVTDHNVLAVGERWVDVAKAKGGEKAFSRLQSEFPDWIDTREKDGRTEVRLRTFEEVRDKVASTGEFLMMPGEEISDRYGNKPIHMNASNIGEVIPPMGGDSVADTMQRNVNAVWAQRERTGRPILIHLNHPNFGYAVTPEDLFQIRGEKFFEVYNGHPGVHNTGDGSHLSTEQIWDIVLAHRLGLLGLPVMYGLATDDAHNYHNMPSRASEPGRGWVQVLAEDLTAESLIAALEDGAFYSSSGVELTRIGMSSRGLTVEVADQDGADYRIEFIGTRKGFDPKAAPTSADDAPGTIGAVLATVEGNYGSYQFDGDEIYVRARITSSKTHPNPSEPGDFERAWTQPLLGPAAMKESHSDDR